jgi:hypothetical protein
MARKFFTRLGLWFFFIFPLRKWLIQTWLPILQMSLLRLPPIINHDKKKHQINNQQSIAITL